MAKGVSIHIGLDFIDPKHYGSNGNLPFCVKDAERMRKLAFDEGYRVDAFLINEHATTVNVTAALSKAAEKLNGGDILLLTYSGHGGYFPDLNKDEETCNEGDKYDEAWLLYDRMFIDDELYFAWSKFKKGVRILLISDSCHSGTIAKPAVIGGTQELRLPEKSALIEMLKYEGQRIYKNHQSEYDPHICYLPSPADFPIQASVILLAASKDNEIAFGISRSGKEYSLFTDELITVYESKQQQTYPEFLEEIKRRIPGCYAQTPNYFKTGAGNNLFYNQRPFSI